MSTETSTPVVADAPAEAPVESPVPKEIDEQPSTQLDSETAVPSEVPAAADSASNATEAMSQVQEEEESTGDSPAKELDFALRDVVDSGVTKTEFSPADNSENPKGARRPIDLSLLMYHKLRFSVLFLQIKFRMSPRSLPKLPPARLRHRPRTRMIPPSRGSSGRFRSPRSRLFQPRSSRFRSRGCKVLQVRLTGDGVPSTPDCNQRAPCQ
jgi:hypothetical protein